MGSRRDLRPPVPISTLPKRAALDAPDQVVWLDCRGRTPSSLYEDLHPLLESLAGAHGVLLVIPVHLEQVEGPLTSFILGLESILHSLPLPVVLGDPSGYATLVLRTLHRDTEVRIYRPTAPPGRLRRTLIVDGSGASANVIGAVLETFGLPFTLARSGAEARRALKSADYDSVLLDLDLPRMQSFEIAESLNGRPRVTMVAVTSTDCAPETVERYGLRRILQKPHSVLDVLDELAGTPA